MLTPTHATYSTVLLPVHTTLGDLQRVVEPYQAMIVTQFRTILDRTERSAYYPWIDTKINLTTGEELPPVHPLLGRDVASGWVQGRGLESIAKFAAWLAPFQGDPEVDRLLTRARGLSTDLLARLQQARTQNNGHLHFLMDPAGRAFSLAPSGDRLPLHLQAGSPYGYSDLFGAKGMFAAANLVGNAAAAREARAFCLDVYRDILARTFRSDQPQPTFGARAWVDRAFTHGPAMIALGMAALFAQFEPGPESTAMGLSLARYVIENHVNLGQKWPELQEYDLVEYVDEEGKPLLDESGRVISDPGHSLEFAGLFLKFSQAVRRYGGATGAQLAEMGDMERAMPGLLARAFANGYRADVGGICKTVDLLTRRPVDDTMPWWSLPETIRAGLAAAQVAETDADRAECLEILALSHNAFVQHYVRPGLHLMAVKLRGADGQALDLMPAYPDADPGYHTALSLIDALELA